LGRKELTYGEGERRDVVVSGGRREEVSESGE